MTALAVGTALFSVSADSRQERTTNSRVQRGRAAFYSPVLEGHKTPVVKKLERLEIV
jgi:hypothetical protein